MTAVKKEYNKKVAKETNEMSQEEKEHYLFVDKMDLDTDMKYTLDKIMGHI